MIRSVTIEPEPPQWRRLLDHKASNAEFAGRSVAQWRAQTQVELFERSLTRVIATGHQPGFWHSGILAKYFAADAAAARLRADAVVELLVDQDVVDLRRLRLPVIDSDGRLHVHEESWESHRARSHADRPAGTMRPMSPDHHRLDFAEDRQAAIPTIHGRWQALRQALKVCETIGSQAEQFASANALMRETRYANRRMRSAALLRAKGEPRPRYLLCASEMPRTTLWHAILEKAREDPERMWNTYNEAVAARWDAGIAPLGIGPGGSLEIPFWLITIDGKRHRAFEHDLQRRTSMLWPRALLMTAFMRLGVCDLFIHGTSGAEYDVITDAWIKDWLGVSSAPTTTVTATLTLDFDCDAADERELARAKWFAHHVRYNLDRLLADSSPRQKRSELLQAIEAAPYGSDERRELFEEMRTLQRALVESHHEYIDHADAAVKRAEQRLAQTEIVQDRTWPFVLFAHWELVALREQIAARFKD